MLKVWDELSDSIAAAADLENILQCPVAKSMSGTATNKYPLSHATQSSRAQPDSPISLSLSAPAVLTNTAVLCILGEQEWQLPAAQLSPTLPNTTVTHSSIAWNHSQTTSMNDFVNNPFSEDVFNLLEITQ
jgi:hypothetical protein